jgi:hypothetical protein
VGVIVFFRSVGEDHYRLWWFNGILWWFYGGLMGFYGG